ncbi:MAG: hypothetical protein AB7E37_01225 [Candidatus Altimarinota bacterium]
MKKMFVTLVCILLSYGISFAENGDILSVKFMHSPVLTSTEESAQVISLLQKGYVVLDLGSNGDYTHIMLTDGKKGYILSSSLENYTFNNYKINGNKGSIQTNTAFYSQPHSSSKQIGTLSAGSEFYIMHVNYINSKFLKIKIINGPLKNKTGYIESNNVNISHLSDFKSEIQKFIEKYAKNKESVLYMNNSSSEYQPLFEGDELGNTVSVFQQQNKTSSSNATSLSNNNGNILNSNSTSNITNSTSNNTGSASKTNTSSNTSSTSNSNNNDISEFLKMLDTYTSPGTTSSTKNNSSSSSSSTKTTTGGGGSSGSSTNSNNNSSSNNNDISDFLDLLNLDKYLSGTTNSGTTTNTQSNNDINDFLNLLNLDNLSSQINNSSQTEDVNSFLDSLNKTLNTSSSGTTTQETQQNDIENFLKLLNSGF